jgi:hypothetical protein
MISTALILYRRPTRHSYLRSTTDTWLISSVQTRGIQGRYQMKLIRTLHLGSLSTGSHYSFPSGNTWRSHRTINSMYGLLWGICSCSFLSNKSVIFLNRALVVQSELPFWAGHSLFCARNCRRPALSTRPFEYIPL